MKTLSISAFDTVMLRVVYAKCHNAESRYAEYHYAECRGASHASCIVMFVNYDRKLLTMLATNKQQRL
jgi:hypothetical protein